VIGKPKRVKKNTLAETTGCTIHIRRWRYYNNIDIVIVVYTLYIMTPQCSGMQSLGVLYTLTSGPAVATAHTQRTICMHVEVYNIRSCVMVLQVYTVYTGRRPRCARNRIYYLYNIYVLNTICRRIIIIIFTGFKTPLTRRFLRNDRNSSGTIPTLYNNM